MATDTKVIMVRASAGLDWKINFTVSIPWTIGAINSSRSLKVVSGADG
jgi:hypothetical protein